MNNSINNIGLQRHFRELLIDRDFDELRRFINDHQLSRDITDMLIVQYLYDHTENYEDYINLIGNINIDNSILLERELLKDIDDVNVRNIETLVGHGIYITRFSSIDNFIGQVNNFNDNQRNKLNKIQYILNVYRNRRNDMVNRPYIPTSTSNFTNNEIFIQLKNSLIHNNFTYVNQLRLNFPNIEIDYIKILKYLIKNNKFYNFKSIVENYNVDINSNEGILLEIALDLSLDHENYNILEYLFTRGALIYINTNYLFNSIIADLRNNNYYSSDNFNAVRELFLHYIDEGRLVPINNNIIAIAPYQEEDDEEKQFNANQFNNPIFRRCFHGENANVASFIDGEHLTDNDNIVIFYFPSTDDTFCFKYDEWVNHLNARRERRTENPVLLDSNGNYMYDYEIYKIINPPYFINGSYNLLTTFNTFYMQSLGIRNLSSRVSETIYKAIPINRNELLNAIPNFNSNLFIPKLQDISNENTNLVNKNINLTINGDFN